MIRTTGHGENHEYLLLNPIPALLHLGSCCRGFGGMRSGRPRALAIRPEPSPVRYMNSIPTRGSSSHLRAGELLRVGSSRDLGRGPRT